MAAVGVAKDTPDTQGTANNLAADNLVVDTRLVDIRLVADTHQVADTLQAVDTRLVGNKDYSQDIQDSTVVGNLVEDIPDSKVEDNQDYHWDIQDKARKDYEIRAEEVDDNREPRPPPHHHRPP